MYARGKISRCARSVALEGSRGVTRNVTRFGKHNYVVAYRHVDTRRRSHAHTRAYKIEEGRKSEYTGARDERENIESLRRNIARCVMHERASDSRRVNSLWIDAIKQKKST